MNVPPCVLMRGAWYALQQAGFLLRHSTVLYEAEAYSTAVGVALLGREELGRYDILADLWRQTVKDCRTFAIAEVRAACEDHVEKQRRAQFSIVTRAEGTGGLATLLRKLLHAPVYSPEARAARQTLDEVNERKRKRTPHDRHTARMRAFYVDLNELGSDWTRPSDISAREAIDCIFDATNDYAVQRDRFITPGVLEGDEADFAAALAAWPDCPELPSPMWPKLKTEQST